VTLNRGHRVDSFLERWSERNEERDRGRLRRQSSGEQDFGELSKQVVQLLSPPNNDADIRRTLWSFGEAAAGPALKNMVRHQSRPASLVGGPKSPSVIAVEILEGSHDKTIAGQDSCIWDTS